MSDKERSISLGTVVAFGFIILGILNLFGALHYKKSSTVSSTRTPAILFMVTGLIILIVKAIRNSKER
jgi:quinol-cytochrome oxidoreductase complex cytochrome b subunit